jgi:predicted DNA-binding protein (UPF0251 family)
MPRPPKPRRVGRDPRAVHFKPQGVPLRSLGEVDLGRDELEALRLADMEGCSHEEVGAEMEVSRATAGRILAAARAKVAEALVRGLAIRISGGPVTRDGDQRGEDMLEPRSPDMPGRDKTGPMNEGPATGRGLGGCKETNTENENGTQTGVGRGRGGAGRGRGRGRGFGPGDGTGNRGRGRGRGRGPASD